MMEPSDAFGLLRSLLAHRAHVADGLAAVASDLERRAHLHDLSKLSDDEFSGYCRINAGVREGAAFGSPEYRALMERERGTIDQHFTRNRHHPERPGMVGKAAEIERGLLDDFTYFRAHDAAAMTFLDVIEMVVDWYAAWRAYGDRKPWAESVLINFTSKGKYLSDHQLWLAQSVAGFLGSMA